METKFQDRLRALRTELALRRMMSEADEVQIEGIYRVRKSKHRKEQKHAEF